MHPIKFSITASHDTESADPKLTDLNGNLVDGQITFATNKEKGTLTTKVQNFQVLVVWVLQFYMLQVQL